jgi:hypothetical protein
MLRAGILIIAAAVVLGAGASAAQADDIFSKVGCGTAHQAHTFTLSSPSKLALSVFHEPGRWGHMRVVGKPSDQLVWEFRQSYAWIYGEYTVESGTLPAGTYRVDYWSDNTAQLYKFCQGTLSAHPV